MGATFGAVTDTDSALGTVLGGAFVALVTASTVLIVSTREPRAALRSRALRIARASRQWVIDQRRSS